MTVKQFKAKYAELNPKVRLYVNDRLNEDRDLNSISKYYDSFDRVRYVSNIDVAGELYFFVYAYFPDSGYHRTLEDFATPSEYFRYYCEEIGYEFVSYLSHSDKYYLLQFQDPDSHASDDFGYELFYLDDLYGDYELRSIISCDHQSGHAYIKQCFDSLKIFDEYNKSALEEGADK